MSRPYFLFSIRIHVRCRHRSKYLLPQTIFNVFFIFFDNQLLKGLISFKLLFQRNMKNKKNEKNDINIIFIVWNIERSFFFWFVAFFLCILHKFAFSQIIQDGLELQIVSTIWLLDIPDLSQLVVTPLLSIWRTINVCHTSVRFYAS